MDHSKRLASLAVASAIGSLASGTVALHDIAANRVPE